MKSDVQPVALEQQWKPDVYEYHAPMPQSGCTHDEWHTWFKNELEVNGDHYFGAGYRERMAVPYHVRFEYGKHAPEWYIEQNKKQGGCCAICGLKPKRKLVIDHCHATKKLRALLCGKCNTGLGMFKDRTLNFLRAAAYVEHFRELAIKEQEK